MIEVIAKHNGKYKTQRDNVKIYYLNGSNYVDETGKVLFPASEIDEHESKLFDRTTECFISTGSMFCDALYNAKIIATPVDELAYKIGVIENAKGKEDRFYWNAHERFLDMIIKNRGYDFFILKAKPNIPEIVKSIDSGFPVMCSIWIKPWYPSGKGHLTLIVGYKKDKDGNLLGFIVNDPFGDCLSQYKNHDGEKVFYPIKEFNKMLNAPEEYPRFIGLVRQK
jgi:hypothetical protein